MDQNELYSVEREYPVDVETLWHAWVDEAALEAWYSPVDLKVVPGSVTNEVRVDGIWALAVDVSKYAQPNAYFYGRYAAVEPLRKMVHTMHYTQVESEAMKRDFGTEYHTIAIDFEDRGASSWCRFTQFGQMPAEEAEMARAGMTSYFENLARFLSQREADAAGV